MPRELAGHERQRKTEREQVGWQNQLELVADCSGSTAEKACEWHQAGRTWEHITAPVPGQPFHRK